MMNLSAIFLTIITFSILLPSAFAESNPEMAQDYMYQDKSDKMMMTVQYIPPLKQLNLIDDLHGITCKDNQQLIFKKDVWSPACVYKDSIPKLIERGWADSHDPTHIDMKMPNDDDANTKPIITAPPTVTVDNIVDANNQFAFNFYSQILQDEKTQNKNIFFSPLSIFMAFAIAYEGSEQNTAKEMQQVFGFEPDDQKRKNQMSAMLSGLNHTEGWYNLEIANALWVKEQYQIKQDYADTAKTDYSSTVENVNFVTDQGINSINDWVKEKTNDKIQDILAPGSTDEFTRMIITNAIYFNAKWALEFNPTYTEEKDFWTDNENSSKVMMMKKPVGKYNYAKTDSLQALELKYLGGDISMLILLPHDIDGLKSLESSLDAEKIKSIQDAMTRQPITVQIPKFEFDTKYDLISPIQSLGVGDAFDPNLADFTKITDEQIYIQKAAHKAFVNVNEEGTEAAAITALVAVASSGPPEPVGEFIADHPFVFVIQKNDSDQILFVGRVVDPTQ